MMFLDFQDRHHHYYLGRMLLYRRIHRMFRQTVMLLHLNHQNRLLDPKQDAIKQAITQQQRPQGFYEFADLDVDRYVVDGKLQQMIVAARVVAEKLPNSSWENTHLAYTHGHGLVAAPASRVATDGRPAYLAEKDNTALGVTRP
jgi:uncharacterized membrane protein (UPF0182 family)